MKVTMDKVGRVVIPKALRDRLGLGPEVELEVTSDGSSLSLRPIAPQQRTITSRDGFPLIAPLPGSVITDDDVQQLRDELQR